MGTVYQVWFQWPYSDADALELECRLEGAEFHNAITYATTENPKNGHYADHVEMALADEASVRHVYGLCAAANVPKVTVTKIVTTELDPATLKEKSPMPS